jgi:hypothetical protein
VPPGPVLVEVLGQDLTAIDGHDRIVVSRPGCLPQLDYVASGGDHAGALELSQRLLVNDPYDEDAHRRAIDALLQLRRFGDAERAHGTYARQMQELGARPTPFEDLLTA